VTSHLIVPLRRDPRQSELRAEIEDRLFLEAELLDERRYEEWLDLFADDLVYFMPIRRNVKYGNHAQENTREGIDACWFDEDKWTLTKRVEQIRTGIHWADEPQSRVCHLISNVRVADVVPSLEAPQELLAKSHFLIYQNRVATETTMFVGRREDRFRNIEGTWKIARREILLDQNVLTAKNLTVFF
jgi:3-phenylpropionate/cinnamic acid dioxygenase small subunit